MQISQQKFWCRVMQNIHDRDVPDKRKMIPSLQTIFYSSIEISQPCLIYSLFLFVNCFLLLMKNHKYMWCVLFPPYPLSLIFACNSLIQENCTKPLCWQTLWWLLFLFSAYWSSLSTFLMWAPPIMYPTRNMYCILGIVNFYFLFVWYKQCFSDKKNIHFLVSPSERGCPKLKNMIFMTKTKQKYFTLFHEEKKILCDWNQSMILDIPYIKPYGI